MYSSVTSCALVGVEPKAVQIETVVSAGSSPFVIVGLPDAAIRESRQRVKAAIREAGFRFPGNVVVNLSPADLPKVGATYDLPIALSIIAAASDNQIRFDNFVSVGELSLHGRVRPVRAALGATVLADQQRKTCLLSSESVIAATPRGQVAGVSTLRDAVALSRGQQVAEGVRRPEPIAPSPFDLSEIREQVVARRALEIAAAGRHNLFLIGPPGAGKTLLARSLPSILPPLTPAEQQEVALVWAASGIDRPVSELPPFRSPHHSSSVAALVGGGAGLPTPGEVSRAHRGALFLDELGEFPARVLDSLRQPIEDGFVTVARQAASCRFPTSVQLIAASNPCPCGYFGDRRKECVCLDTPKARYRAKLSGPLFDRFDMRVDVARLRTASLTGPRGETSAEVLKRVVAARQRQDQRGALNSKIAGGALDDVPWSADAMAGLQDAAEQKGLSARGWDRVRRVALTIADLDDSESVEVHHAMEAVDMRGVLR